MTAPAPEDPVEQLGGIALFVEALVREVLGVRATVSIDAVRRAVLRKGDPLPARRVMGRWIAAPSSVRAWFLRQPGNAQLELFAAPAKSA